MWGNGRPYCWGWAGYMKHSYSSLHRDTVINTKVLGTLSWPRPENSWSNSGSSVILHQIFVRTSWSHLSCPISSNRNALNPYSKGTQGFFRAYVLVSCTKSLWETFGPFSCLLPPSRDTANPDSEGNSYFIVKVEWDPSFVASPSKMLRNQCLIEYYIGRTIHWWKGCCTFRPADAKRAVGVQFTKLDLSGSWQLMIISWFC